MRVKVTRIGRASRLLAWTTCMQTAHWVRRIICSVTPNGAAGFEPASFALVCISEYLYQGLLSSVELRSVVVAQASPRDGGQTCAACMVMAEVLG